MTSPGGISYECVISHGSSQPTWTHRFSPVVIYVGFFFFVDVCFIFCPPSAPFEEFICAFHMIINSQHGMFLFCFLTNCKPVFLNPGPIVASLCTFPIFPALDLFPPTFPLNFTTDYPVTTWNWNAHGGDYVRSGQYEGNLVSQDFLMCKGFFFFLIIFF